MAMTAARAHYAKTENPGRPKGLSWLRAVVQSAAQRHLPEQRAHILQYEYNNPSSLREAFRMAGDVAGVFASRVPARR